MIILQDFIIHPIGAGFLPSTVSPAFMMVFDMMDSCI